MALKNVTFVVSAPSKDHYPNDDKKEIVILGKSNVGKSTFINRITNNSTLAKTSSTPGRTRLLNFFDCGNFRLVDAPGYGYSIISKKMDLDFSSMMEEYFDTRKNLVGAILLIDSRRAGSVEDKQMLDFVLEHNLNFIVIATKCDKLNQSEKSKLVSSITTCLDLPADTKIYQTSINKDKWIDEVIERINYIVS